MAKRVSVGRSVNRLAARRVETEKRPGRHSDGNNLYLVVDPSGAKRWVFIYRWKRPGAAGPGKLREMGLGSTRAVDLKEARALASAALKALAAGEDPIGARRALRERPTFGEVADGWLKDNAGGVRSNKSLARRKRALEVYAAPLRPIRVDNVSTEDVLAVLKPIWVSKAETAKMARGYIERVLNAAKAQGWRSGENPARWNGHLDHLLARTPRLQRGHHKAMAYADIPALMKNLAGRDATAAKALMYLILTAGRSGEIREADWSEIDFKAKVWTIPGSRMKAGHEHRVPLSDQAVAILHALQPATDTEAGLIFPGQKLGRPLSDMAFKQLLARLAVKDCTPHGFRSAFRDWAGDQTNYPRELAEQALAHRIGDQAEQAYRRSDALERRRAMMAEWGRHCMGGKAAANDELGRDQSADAVVITAT
ncbi:MAG: tyrosine-type recombinase/integrase [Caulobacterales bacterium]|nr:tyrosine-type recombinase/integrase [Caulobacterales bacterium]